MKNLDYGKAGVNINLGDKLVELIKPMAKRTKRPEVLAGIGGFSALFDGRFRKMRHPVIVSSTDGVGTKLKLAFLLNRHSTVGIDLVAMGVNDIITCGAEPLFFLDYFACGKLNIRTASLVIKGIAEGCLQAGCALIGGETAEMPGFYKPGEYDLAGFAVGVVDREKIIDGKTIRPGDAILGLPSTGPHSNGYSLIRKVFSPGELKKYGNKLIAPTRIYAGEVETVTRKMPGAVKGLAHITGGGLLENVPRILPKNCRAVIGEKSCRAPEIFRLIQKRGGVARKEMFRAFNMGIGMVIVAGKKEVPGIKRILPAAVTIGEIVKGNSEEVAII